AGAAERGAGDSGRAGVGIVASQIEVARVGSGANKVQAAGPADNATVRRAREPYHMDRQRAAAKSYVSRTAQRSDGVVQTAEIQGPVDGYGAARRQTRTIREGNGTRTDQRRPDVS